MITRKITNLNLVELKNETKNSPLCFKKRFDK